MRRAFAAAAFGAVSLAVKYGSAANGILVKVSVASSCVCALTCASMACMRTGHVCTDSSLRTCHHVSTVMQNVLMRISATHATSCLHAIVHWMTLLQ